MRAKNIFIFVVSRWPWRPRHRKRAWTGGKMWNRGAFTTRVGVSRPTRPARIPARLVRTLLAPTRTRRAATYSTHGRNASSDPTLAGAIAIMAMAKNFGAGINAWNHGMNIWKSRRRVWYLCRGPTRAIGLPVTAASRKDRPQTLPQLTPPERFGQAVLDTETLDLVLPKDESRLNDDGRRDAGRAQPVYTKSR